MARWQVDAAVLAAFALVKGFLILQCRGSNPSDFGLPVSDGQFCVCFLARRSASVVTIFPTFQQGRKFNGASPVHGIKSRCPMLRDPWSMLPACLLALVAGYADTVGYLRYDAFAGLMTGNTILLGIDVANGRAPSAAFHGGIIAVFLAGVIASRVLLQLRHAAWLALTVAAILLVVCSFIGRFWAAMLLAFAMGMQNSAANRFNGVALNTVFITGNLQKLGEGLTHWLWRICGRPIEKSEGVAIFALIWIAYAIGAGLGALGEMLLRWPLLLPAALLPFVMMQSDALPSLRKRRERG